MKTFYKINNGLAKLWLFCSISIFEETSYFFWLICGLPVGVSCMFVYLKVEKQNKTQVQACISPHSSLKKCSNCNHNSSKQDNTDSHSAKHGNKISTLPKLFSYQVMEFFTQSVVMVFLPSITHSRHVMANTHTHQQVVIPPGELCINHISQHIPSVYLSKAVEFASFNKLQLERFPPPSSQRYPQHHQTRKPFFYWGQYPHFHRTMALNHLLWCNNTCEYFTIAAQ